MARNRLTKQEKLELGKYELEKRNIYINPSGKWYQYQTGMRGYFTNINDIDVLKVIPNEIMGYDLPKNISSWKKESIQRDISYYQTIAPVDITTKEILDRLPGSICTKKGMEKLFIISYDYRNYNYVRDYTIPETKYFYQTLYHINDKYDYSQFTYKNPVLLMFGEDYKARNYKKLEQIFKGKRKNIDKNTFGSVIMLYERKANEDFDTSMLSKYLYDEATLISCPIMKNDEGKILNTPLYRNIRNRLLDYY